MSEIVWQLQTHQVVLKHEEVQSEVLNSVIDIPCMSDPLFNKLLLLDKELITLDCAAWHK